MQQDSKFFSPFVKPRPNAVHASKLIAFLHPFRSLQRLDTCTRKTRTIRLRLTFKYRNEDGHECHCCSHCCSSPQLNGCEFWSSDLFPVTECVFPSIRSPGRFVSKDLCASQVFSFGYTQKNTSVSPCACGIFEMLFVTKIYSKSVKYVDDP